jgi:hypothetical protein
MANNPASHESTIGDMMANPVERFHDEIDFLKNRDSIKKNSYLPEIRDATGGVGPTTEMGTLFFPIETSDGRVISMQDSFIHMTHSVGVKIPKQKFLGAAGNRTGTRLTEFYYFGQLLAAMIIDSYNLKSNNAPQAFWQQPKAMFEWTVLMKHIQDSAAENDESYTTISKIRDLAQKHPGVRIDVSPFEQASANEADGYVLVNVEIPYKIPLSHFMIFRPFKYLLGCFTPLTMEVRTTSRNMVVAPIFDETKIDPALHKYINDHNNADNAYNLYDLGFFQVGEVMTNNFSQTNSGVITSGGVWTHDAWGAVNTAWEIASSRVHSCYIFLDTFELKPADYARLAQSFVASPLGMYVNKTEAMEFQTPIGDTPTISTSQTLNTTNANCAHLIFAETEKSTIRWVNPCCQWQLKIGGSDYYPPKPQDTVYDVISDHLLTDALNYNGSSIQKIPRDQLTSMRPFHRVYKYDKDTSTTKVDYDWTTGSRGHFSIGVPFAPSNCFQTGATYPNVQTTLKLTRTHTNGPPKLSKLRYQMAYMIVIEDKILTVTPAPKVGASGWEILDYTYEEAKALGLLK